MKVTIDSWTPDPIGVIGRQAGICYGKDDPSAKRVRTCVRARHWSVLEHASVTFRIEGVSRAATHQVVRHRHLSPHQESQRYVEQRERYVAPPAVAEDAESLEIFLHAVRTSLSAYHALLERGIRREDARYVLPNASATSIAITASWRALFEFWDKRCARDAQWEIRGMAWAMVDACLENEDTAPMAELWEESASVCRPCVENG